MSVLPDGATAWPLCVIITLAITLRAPNAASADPVDNFIVGKMQEHHIPGVSVAVVRSGKVIKAKGSGLANVEWSTRATMDTVYAVASTTKAFTDTAAMMLVEEGRFSLDDKVADLPPQPPRSWNRVTVRLSGFPRSAPSTRRTPARSSAAASPNAAGTGISPSSWKSLPRPATCRRRRWGSTSA
jgi:CubicO group peptidase (beta-lactamase class C family)